MDKKTYARLADAHAPHSPLLRDCLRAFLVGGAICVLGQALKSVFEGVFSLDEETAGTLTSVSLIFLSVLLSALGVYDCIAKHAGAGTLVPITGFANSIVSESIEFKTEGYILGVGAKMFTLAGPVIVYGTAASVVYGLIYWILSRF